MLHPAKSLYAQLNLKYDRWQGGTIWIMRMIECFFFVIVLCHRISFAVSLNDDISLAVAFSPILCRKICRSFNKKMHDSWLIIEGYREVGESITSWAITAAGVHMIWVLSSQSWPSLTFNVEQVHCFDLIFELRCFNPTNDELRLVLSPVQNEIHVMHCIHHPVRSPHQKQSKEVPKSQSKPIKPPPPRTTATAIARARATAANKIAYNLPMLKMVLMDWLFVGLVLVGCWFVGWLVGCLTQMFFPNLFRRNLP